MSLRVENGVYGLSGGIPRKVTGLEEALQNAALRLNLRRGSFPYGRRYGSRLHELTGNEEHVEERAVSIANEALLDLPGVTVQAAELVEGGFRFTVSTPFGTGEVLYGEL